MHTLVREQCLPVMRGMCIKQAWVAAAQEATSRCRMLLLFIRVFVVLYVTARECFFYGTLLLFRPSRKQEKSYSLQSWRVESVVKTTNVVKRLKFRYTPSNKVESNTNPAQDFIFAQKKIQM